MGSFVSKLQLSGGHEDDIVAISAVTVRGHSCFYFIELDNAKRRAFFCHIKQRKLESAEHYGRVLIRGFGLPDDEDFEHLYQVHGIYLTLDDLNSS